MPRQPACRGVNARGRRRPRSSTSCPAAVPGRRRSCTRPAPCSPASRCGRTRPPTRRSPELPGSPPVHPITPKEVGNAGAATVVQAVQAWQSTGPDRAGRPVGIIDTGIDYTHADFGGPGTVDGIHRRQGRSNTLRPTAKVVGGYDFAGDAYDADPTSGATTRSRARPQPARLQRPRLARRGHDGRSRRRADGTTCTGGYATDIDPAALAIGPGVAPEASLYALKVFGCEGSTNVVGPGARLGGRPRTATATCPTASTWSTCRSAPLRPARRPRRGRHDQAPRSAPSSSPPATPATSTRSAARRATPARARGRRLRRRQRRVDGLRSIPPAGHGRRHPSSPLSSRSPTTGPPSPASRSPSSPGDWSMTPRRQQPDGCRPSRGRLPSPARSRSSMALAPRCGSAATGPARNAGAAGFFRHRRRLPAGVTGERDIPAMLVTAIHGDASSTSSSTVPDPVTNGTTSTTVPQVRNTLVDRQRCGFSSRGIGDAGA